MDAEMAKALRGPFPAHLVEKLPKGGVMLDYTSHATGPNQLQPNGSVVPW